MNIQQLMAMEDATKEGIRAKAKALSMKLSSKVGGKKKKIDASETYYGPNSDMGPAKGLDPE